MRYSSIFFSVMMLGLLVCVQPTFAEEAESTTQATSSEGQTETSAQEAEATAAVEALATEVESVEPSYDGIEIEKPTKTPSRFGSFWRNVKENVSLAVTFDPNKKAEKAMKFAEERMLIAEKVISEGTDEKAKEQAQKHLDRAKKMIQKIDEHQQKALEKPNEETERLLKNRATQFERQKEIFNRLEEKSDDEALETVLKFREEVLQQGKALENAVNNENIPEEIREHLKEVKTRIEEHAGEIKQRVAEFKELKTAAEGGDEVAVKKLEAFKDDRRKEMKMRTDEQQGKTQQFEEKMKKIRDAAEGGDEQAQMMFEKMQDRPEFRETFEDLKGEFEAQLDNESNEGKPEDGDRPNVKDRPDFKNRPEGQGQKPEGTIDNAERKPESEKPGFFKGVKNFLDRKEDGENKPNPEQMNPNEPKAENEFKGENAPQKKPRNEPGGSFKKPGEFGGGEQGNAPKGDNFKGGSTASPAGRQGNPGGNFGKDSNGGSGPNGDAPKGGPGGGQPQNGSNGGGFGGGQSGGGAPGNSGPSGGQGGGGASGGGPSGQ